MFPLETLKKCLSLIEHFTLHVCANLKSSIQHIAQKHLTYLALRSVWV